MIALAVSPLKIQIADLPDLAGEEVRRDRDHAESPEGEHRIDLRIVARVKREIFAEGGERKETVGGIRRLFDPYDVFTGGELFEYGERKIHSGAGGDVVEKDGDIRRFRNPEIMADQSAFRSLVIVRRDDEHTVTAERRGDTGMFARLARIVGPGAEQNLAPAADAIDRPGVKFVTLAVGERRRLSRRTADDQGVDPFVDLSVDQGEQDGIVDLAVRERRHDRRARSAKQDFLFHLTV